MNTSSSHHRVVISSIPPPPPPPLLPTTTKQTRRFNTRHNRHPNYPDMSVTSSDFPDDPDLFPELPPNSTTDDYNFFPSTSEINLIKSHHIQSRASSTSSPTGTTIIIKTEEVVIVALVLTIWIGVILLFIRKWGKIRGLEPYTPTFEHRNSSSNHSTAIMIPPPVVPTVEGGRGRLTPRHSIPDPLPLSSIAKNYHHHHHNRPRSNSRQCETFGTHFPFPPPPNVTLTRPSRQWEKKVLLYTNPFASNLSKKVISSEPDVRVCSTLPIRPPHTQKNLQFDLSSSSGSLK